MSVASLVEGGIGPESTIPLLLTGGLYLGAAPVPPVVTSRPGGSGGWAAKKKPPRRIVTVNGVRYSVPEQRLDEFNRKYLQPQPAAAPPAPPPAPPKLVAVPKPAPAPDPAVQQVAAATLAAEIQKAKAAETDEFLKSDDLTLVVMLMLQLMD